MGVTKFAAPVALPLAMSMALAGCGSFGAIGLPVFNRSPPPPQVEPAPLPPVETTALPPPGGAQQQVMQQPVQQQDPFLPSSGTPPQGTVATTGQGTTPQQTALAQPPTTTTTASPPPATGLGRTDLLGGWTITSGGDSCQLFMTLTSWTGGYRASTRGCASDTLKAISAWNLQGDQVVLAGQGGTPVARLYASGSGRFDGQTEGQGAAVSFYR